LTDTIGTLDARRKAAQETIRQQRLEEGRQAAPSWFVGDVVCAATMKNGRTHHIQEGMVVFASSCLVVVAFDRYRETFAPWEVWAAIEEPPSWVKDKLDHEEDDA